MTKMDYVVGATILATILSYLMLQFSTLMRRKNRDRLSLTLPFLCWGGWLQYLFSDLHQNPGSHQLWYLEIATITIIASAALFGLDWADSGMSDGRNARTAGKRRKSGNRQAQATQTNFDIKTPRDLSPLEFRERQLSHNLERITKLIAEKRVELELLSQQQTAVQQPDLSHSMAP